MGFEPMTFMVLGCVLCHGANKLAQLEEFKSSTQVKTKYLNLDDICVVRNLRLMYAQRGGGGGEGWIVKKL